VTSKVERISGKRGGVGGNRNPGVRPSKFYGNAEVGCGEARMMYMEKMGNGGLRGVGTREPKK